MTNKEELIRAAEMFVDCCNEHFLRCNECPLIVSCGDLKDDFGVLMKNLIVRMVLAKYERLSE